MKNKNTITASEISEYIYCQRAWWLRVNGYLEGDTHAMDLGTKKHNDIFRNLRFLRSKKIIAILLVIIGLYLISLTITFLIL